MSIILVLLFLSFGKALSAQEPVVVNIKSTIEEVTVYKQNAKITRKAKANVPAGKSELVLKGLSQKILINSIQVKLSNNNIALISAVPRVNYLEETSDSERYKKVKDSIDLIAYQLKEIEIKERVIQSTKSTLMDNNPLKSSKNEDYTIEDVKKVMDFRRKELMTLENELLELSYKKSNLQQKNSLLYAQQTYLSLSKKKPTGELVLQVQSTSAVSTDIEVEYVVTNATWTPIYDLKSEGIGKPLKLVYKAHVTQSTGIDWEQVKVRLSSSNPSLSHDRPILNPMKLNLTDLAAVVQRQKGNTYIQYQGSGNVVLEQEFVKNNPERGINSAIATISTVNAMDLGESINSNGSRSSSNDTYIDGVRVIGTVAIPEETILITEDALANNNSTIDFELELLQDIPSDGEAHIIEVAQHELEVSYEYHIVPKLDKGAFLLAKISNYGKYNLLSGKANIFFDKVYLGQSFIDATITSDTLLLSLGRDEKITVLREKVKSIKKENGSFVKENITFEISVRNNKSEAIEINLLDQIPVSKNKDLEVKLLESTSAIYHDLYGSLRWIRIVNPNETIKLRFEYEVKYPKDKGVVQSK